MRLNQSLKSLGFQYRLLTFIGLITQTAATQCYFPNGSKSTTGVPCYTKRNISHCCGEEWICLTNGYCVATIQPYHLSRGSCTDPDFGDECPQACKTAQEGSGVTLAYLNGTGTDSNYCCNKVVVDDSSGEMVCGSIDDVTQSPFTLDEGYVIGGVANLSSFPVVSGDLINSTESTNVSSNTSTSSGSSGGDGHELDIGVGVGVPLGVIAILSMGWALWERKQRKAVSKVGESSYSAQTLQPFELNGGNDSYRARNPRPIELNGVRSSELEGK